jgi:hypothetical protein
MPPEVNNSAMESDPAQNPIPLPVNPAGAILGPTATPTSQPQQQTTQPTQAQPSAGDQIKDHLATGNYRIISSIW